MPSVLYRYMKRDLAEALISDGRIEVGTLFHYRKQELLGDQVGDAEEGILTSTKHFEHAQKEDVLRSQVASRIIEVGGRGNVLRNCNFALRQAVDDAWVFCCCRQRIESGLRTFDSEVCVTIQDPLAFFRAITEQMYERGLATEFLMGECVYRDREFPEDEEPGPIELLKPARYAAQCETRGIWAPRLFPIELLKLTVPALRQYVSFSDVR
jgi:hypothetical protein